MSNTKGETNDLGTDLRTARVVIYMTEDDAASLNRISKDLGMKSRSALIVSVMERHIISGFSPIGGFKLCLQIQDRFNKLGGSSSGFYFGVRPLPALPEERSEVKDIRKAFNKEIQTLEKQTSC